MTKVHIEVNRNFRTVSWENQQFAYVKTNAQISFAVTAKLISAFIFATRIVQSLYFLNTKFHASSRLLLLCSPVCVGPGRKPQRWFSYEAAQMILRRSSDSASLGTNVTIHQIALHTQQKRLRKWCLKAFDTNAVEFSKNGTVQFGTCSPYIECHI